MKKKLLIIVAVIGVLVIGLVFVFQSFINQYIYPQSILYEPSNLSLRGIITSIKQNQKTQGMAITDYHIFPYYLQLNMTEIIWTNDDYLNSSIGTDKVLGSNSISVGYDYLDNPHLSVGDEIECKGYYSGYTDSSYSFVLAVSPCINESYLNLYYQ